MKRRSILRLGPQVGPEKGEELERRHTAQGGQWVVLGEDELEFMKKARFLEAVKEVHLHRVLDQFLGMAGNGEVKAALKTDGTEDAGGILDKAEIVQNLNAPFLEIVLAVEVVDQGTRTGPGLR